MRFNQHCHEPERKRVVFQVALLVALESNCFARHPLRGSVALFVGRPGRLTESCYPLRMPAVGSAFANHFLPGRFVIDCLIFGPSYCERVVMLTSSRNAD